MTCGRFSPGTPVSSPDKTDRHDITEISIGCDSKCHNRLNQHLNRVMKIIPSPMCSCGEAEQDTSHILQTCKNHQALRRDMAITNNTPGDALWTRGCPTEDYQIRSGNWTPSVKAKRRRRTQLLLKVALAP